jgi:hypothetical protein
MKQKHKINRVSSPRCCSVDRGETIQTLLQIYSKWKLETGKKVEREMVGKKGFIRTFFHVRMFPCIPTISISTFFWVSNFHSKPLLIWSMLSQSDPTIGLSFCIHNLPFNLASKGALQFFLLGCQRVLTEVVASLEAVCFSCNRQPPVCDHLSRDCLTGSPKQELESTIASQIERWSMQLERETEGWIKLAHRWSNAQRDNQSIELRIVFPAQRICPSNFVRAKSPSL